MATRQLSAELIGTFALVFIGAGSGAPGPALFTGNPGQLSIGLAGPFAGAAAAMAVYRMFKAGR